MLAAMLLLGIIVWGLAAGWLAHLILGGRGRPNEWGPLLVAGLVGSFVGGLAVSLISGDGLALKPSGIIGTVLGAVAVLAAWDTYQNRKA